MSATATPDIVQKLAESWSADYVQVLLNAARGETVDAEEAKAAVSAAGKSLPDFARDLTLMKGLTIFPPCGSTYPETL